MANGINENTPVPVKWLAGTIAVCFAVSGTIFLFQARYYDDRVATSAEIARTVKDALAVEREERNRDMLTLNNTLDAIRLDNRQFRSDIVAINQRLAVDEARLEEATKARYTSLDAAKDWLEAEHLNTFENMQEHGWRAPRNWHRAGSTSLEHPIQPQLKD